MSSPANAARGGVGINGAAAHLVHPGDVIIIIGYGMLTDAEARTRAAHVVFVDADNRIVQLGSDPGDVPAGFGLLPSGIGLSYEFRRPPPVTTLVNVPNWWPSRNSRLIVCAGPAASPAKVTAETGSPLPPGGSQLKTSPS